MLMRRRSSYSTTSNQRVGRSMYYENMRKLREFEQKNPDFTGDFDDLPEGEALRVARRRMKGYL